MSANDAQILQQLKSATAGLLFMSESDYPFELIHWDGTIDLTRDYLCRRSGFPEDCRVEETTVDEFFVTERYKNVVHVLTRNLTGLRVYRVGERNIAVYIVGRSKEGNWLGVSTRVVWT